MASFFYYYNLGHVGKGMKENWKYKKLFFVMVIVVIISLVLTGVIFADLFADVSGNGTKYWFFEESLQTGENVELENAYIYSSEKGQLEFLYDNIIYNIDGYLSEEYTGVADVVVDGDQIAKVIVKNDTTSGVLNSYNENSLEVLTEIVNTNAGVNNAITDDVTNIEVLQKNTSIPLYKVQDGEVFQANWNQVIVGTSQIQCILENGQVCAVIIEESLPNDIRVLIKNGSSIFYENLYIMKQSDGSFIDVAKEMSEQGINTMELTDEIGLVICDSNKAATGEAYEGSFRILKEEEGYVLVNQLPIETYVKYVLPSEMPTSFHEEALKAQAVCARTFAYSHMSNQSYAKYGANLDDSTSFQVYHNTGRYDKTDAAVDTTKGEFITCNGELIACYYFSTSAGTTNDMSVWGTDTPEYISMCESKDTESPFYKWTAYLDISTVRESSYGALKSVEVLSSNAAGYATEVKLKYENEELILTKENDIRRTLGSYLQETVLNNGKVRTDLAMIPSANIKVIEVSEDQIVLEGGGFGHGIGLSQYGANQMANAGSDYKAIIEHYFYNVVVKDI